MNDNDKRPKIIKRNDNREVKVYKKNKDGSLEEISKDEFVASYQDDVKRINKIAKEALE